MPDTRLDVEDGVAVLTLDRPERLNAITSEMAEELRAHLEAVVADERVGALVLTGAGRGFCAGGDVQGLSEPRADEGASDGGAAGDAKMRQHLHIVELLHEMPKVTVAAVNGPAAGAGMAWACACDIRVAAESAVFLTAFLGVAQTGDYGLTWTLPRLVGMGRARELFLLNRRVGADEALRIGLVSEVVPEGELLVRAQAIAASVGSSAPLTLAALKANLADGERLPFAALLDQETERFGVNRRTDDAREAARAFVEKRTPQFRGR